MPGADAAGLAALQEAQLSAIAFECIGPLLGEVPDLSMAALTDKILRGGRGGYCFELNRLFGEALAAFGFQARAVMARVCKPERGARSHLAHVVQVEGRDWLADTAFGGPGARRPVLLEPSRVEIQGADAYRVVADEAFGDTVLQKRSDEGWVDLYGFDDTPVLPIDLEAANHVCATWAQEPFTSHLMLNRLTPRGRVSAFDTAVTEVCDGVTSKRRIVSVEELAVLLRADFGLAVTPAQVAAIGMRLGLGENALARSQADDLRA